MKKRVLALFSDIHSNYQAFKACAEDAIRNGAEVFVFLGDYVSDLSETKETMKFIYDIKSRYQCYFLRGNRERYMLEYRNGKTVFRTGSKTGSLLYTYENLLPQDLDFFKTLPIYDKLTFDTICFEAAHSLKDNDRYYYDENSEYLNNVFNDMETRYFLTGHAHRQYISHQNNKKIINPGSIGVPRVNGGVAQYCLIEIVNNNVEFTLKKIPYNISKLISKQFSSGLIEQGRYWSISILYDVITGREYTMELLNKVLVFSDKDESAINDEKVWRRCAEDLGIRFTEKEILSLLK